jgi:hypothetical protein
MSSVTPEEICEALDDMGFYASDVDAKVIDRFLSLCTMYDVDADKITSEYLAFLSRKNIDTSSKAATSSLTLMDTFDREVLSKLAAKRKEDERRGIRDVSSLVLNAETNGNGAMDDADESALLAGYGVKPVAKPVKKQVTPDNASNKRASASQFSTPSTLQLENTPTTGKYSMRTRRGETILSHNTEMAPIKDWRTPDGEARIIGVGQMGCEKQLQKPYRCE